MSKVTFDISDVYGLDPEFYSVKASYREQYPDAALIEVLPGKVTVITF